MRVVLDTNILVRANPTVLPKGLARDLLLTILSGPHVLSYPHVQARWPLTPDAIAQYSFLLQDAGAVVDLPESFPAVVTDPDDDFVLQTAIAGQAEVLCTRDAAFRHEKVKEVCAAHGIRILEDITLLLELRQAHNA